MGIEAACHDIEDLRRAARRRLPRGLFDYIDRGCDGETGLAANRAAFDSLRFLPKVLADVSARRLDTTLLGQPSALPVAIAPMSPAGMMWFEGERALAEAASEAGVPYTLPTESMTPLDAIAAIPGTKWFQLYIWNDRALSHALVARAAEAGYSALLVTADTAVSPWRAFNERSGFGTPPRFTPASVFDMLAHPRWLLGTMGRYAAARGLPRMEQHPGRRSVLRPTAPEAGLNPSIAWDDIADLRARWPGKLLVKGILRPDDALRALGAGADGVVVSNHGARNLDGALASIAALPAIAEAMRGRGHILLDSGIRHGSDIARALALGAEGVLVGRAVLYGTAAAGRAGAARALALLRKEFDTTLAMLGCHAPAGITADLVAPG